MKISDHSLRQLDESDVTSLDEAALRGRWLRLLADLKEARERLNQNSGNSSRPLSGQAPWEKGVAATVPAGENVKDTAEEPPGPPGETPVPEERRAAGSPRPVKRAGTPAGAAGHGRPAPERVDAEDTHLPTAYCGCGRSLLGWESSADTGHDDVDRVRDGSGWTVRWTGHLRPMLRTEGPGVVERLVGGHPGRPRRAAALAVVRMEETVGRLPSNV